METIIRSLVITGMGVSVVFITLLALQAFLHLMNLALGQRPASSKAAEELNTSVDEGIPPQHVAAIAGALAILNQGYRIKTIEIVSPTHWEQSRYQDFTASDL